MSGVYNQGSHLRQEVGTTLGSNGINIKSETVVDDGLREIIDNANALSHSDPRSALEFLEGFFRSRKLTGDQIAFIRGLYSDLKRGNSRGSEPVSAEDF